MWLCLGWQGLVRMHCCRGQNKLPSALWQQSCAHTFNSQETLSKKAVFSTGCNCLMGLPWGWEWEQKARGNLTWVWATGSKHLGHPQPPLSWEPAWENCHTQYNALPRETGKGMLKVRLSILSLLFCVLPLTHLANCFTLFNFFSILTAPKHHPCCSASAWGDGSAATSHILPMGTAPLRTASLHFAVPASFFHTFRASVCALADLHSWTSPPGAGGCQTSHRHTAHWETASGRWRQWYVCFKPCSLCWRALSCTAGAWSSPTQYSTWHHSEFWVQRKSRLGGGNFTYDFGVHLKHTMTCVLCETCFVLGPSTRFLCC